MAKAKLKKNKIDTNRIIFSTAYLVVTLIALIFVVVLCVKPFKITSYDDLKQVEYKTYKTQEADEYYVFVYADSRAGNDWYTDIVVQYANKARTLSNYAPIYGYNLEKAGQGKLETEQGFKNVPALLHIKSGAISKTYTNWADIRTTLTNAMEATE